MKFYCCGHENLEKIGLYKTVIIVCAQIPSFFAPQYFSHFKLKVFSKRLPCFHSCLTFPAGSGYPLPRRQIFLLIHFFISLLYIKPLFPINKQWDICLTCSSCHRSQFLPLVLLLLTHFTRYCCDVM